MEECQASGKLKFGFMWHPPNVLNVGIKFRLLFQCCIFYPPPRFVWVLTCIILLWCRGHWERIITLEDPNLEGNEGKKSDSQAYTLEGERGRAEGRQRQSENKLLLIQLSWSWPGPLHFKAALSENKIRQAKAILFPNKLHYSAKYLYWISFRQSFSIQCHSTNLTFKRSFYWWCVMQALTFLKKIFLMEKN